MKFLPFLVLIVLSVACGLTGGEDDRPDIPGKIVFAANDESGHSQIYTMNANGSGLKQITDFSSDHGGVDPAWSPDGSKIVFSTSLNSSSNGLSLYIMNADGSNMHPMNDREGSPIPTPGDNADWSPDGNKITFDQCVNCQVSTNHAIFGYDMKADSVIQLTELVPGVSNTNPTWSQDGNSIAFVSDRDYYDADTLQFRKDIYTINFDGSNLQKLTETGYARDPIWHPEEDIIAFRSSSSSLGLFQLNIKTKEISKIGRTLSDDLQLFPQSWNGDGTKLLISARNQSDPQNYFLYIIDLMMGKAKSIHNKTGITGADWYTSEE